MKNDPIDVEATSGFAIEATSITRSYAQGRTSSQVLKGVSLRVARGEMVAIVGPSGSGKTTLLNCLSGLEPVTSGQVKIAGVDISALSAQKLARLRRERVGFVFQSYNLLPTLTARQNVELPALLTKRRLARSAVDLALGKVGLLQQADMRPGELSGGQQQRVAVARALASRPEVIFADEPTGALDTSAGTAVLHLLRAAADGGQTVVLVTHDLEAAAHGDSVIVLRDGTIQAVLDRPSPEVILAVVERSGARQ